MTLRKITNDNNVKYTHSTNNPAIAGSHGTKPKTRKKNTSKDFPQKNKKFIRNITEEGFRTTKRIMECCS